MEIEIRSKKFVVDLYDRDPYYFEQEYLIRSLTSIYDQLDPEMRDMEFVPYPYFHPKKPDEKQTLFRTMNGILHQIKTMWDNMKFEAEFDNLITVIYINSTDKTYNRRVLSVSMKEKPKAYESKR